MALRYRILFQSYDDETPDTILNEKPLADDSATAPTNCLDFSMGLANQIALIEKAQDSIIDLKLKVLQSILGECPKCGEKLHKYGIQKSTFHDVLTDHNIEVQRLKCYGCGYEPPSTVRTIINTIQSGDLTRIQATLGANFSYRETQDILELFSTVPRLTNNYDRIRTSTETVGKAVEKINKTEKELALVSEAEELVLNVDGGHVKTTDKDKRSMEAMTSVLYRPEALESNSKGTRNYLKNKNCAASVKNDNQQEIINGTIFAALRQGMTENTHITALCDGAANCWNIVDALNPLCGSMTYILDWFHLAMKLENISLPKKMKDKLMRIKWHLWRGKTETALTRLQQLIEIAAHEKHAERLKNFMTYITNNCKRIVNYRERKKAGLVFTSNLAESTVESLINRRCKGQQHMRWSREGLEPILQLRAAINSKGDWVNKWRTAVLNAA